MCLNWAFNISDYRLFTASKHRALLFVQIPLFLEERKASLKWRRPVKCPKAGWEIQKCNTWNILIFIFKTDWTESRWGTFREIKKLGLSLRTCSNMTSAARSLTSALIIWVEIILKRGRKKKFHLDTIWINTGYYLPHSQRCIFYSKLLLLYPLLVLIQPYTKLK